MSVLHITHTHCRFRVFQSSNQLAPQCTTSSIIKHQTSCKLSVCATNNVYQWVHDYHQQTSHTIQIQQVAYIQTQVSISQIKFKSTINLQTVAQLIYPSINSFGTSIQPSTTRIGFCFFTLGNSNYNQYQRGDHFIPKLSLLFTQKNVLNRKTGMKCVQQVCPPQQQMLDFYPTQRVSQPTPCRESLKERQALDLSGATACCCK